MRLLAFGGTVLAAVLGLASGCGQSEGDAATPGGAGNSTTTAGSSNASASAGKAGMSATAGAASGGSSSGGASLGGGTIGGAGGAPTTGGQPDAQGGTTSNGAGAGGLVDCDPKKILCKRAAPVCEAGQVPSVADSCYGDCVKIERCGCSAAEQCPQPEEYTCWAKQHCGYYVQ